MDKKFLKRNNFTDKNFLKYLGILLLIPSCFIVFISLFTVLIDPYAIFDTKKINGINKWKIRSGNVTRISKVSKLFLNKPDKIIIGTSTAEAGFSPKHPFWGDGKIGYNFGLGGGSLLEAYEIFKLAKSYGVKDVILIADFLRFINEKETSNLDISFYKKNILNQYGNSKLLLNWLRITVSPEVIRDSLLTLFEPNINPDSIKNHFLESDGSRAEKFFLLKNIPFYGGNTKNFQRIISRRLDQWNEVCDSELYKKPETKFYSINTFEDILFEAYVDNINLTIILPPIHGSIHYALKEGGYYELYQSWKKHILFSNEKIANKLSKKNYLVYDFSTINEKTLEEIKSEENMIWFYDPLHFTKKYGEEIMNFIFKPYANNNKNNIGSVLNVSTIDKYNESNYKNFKKYKTSFDSYSKLFESTTQKKCKFFKN